MRLAFIGGSGHAYLRGCIDDPTCDIERPVAVASDGLDVEAARNLAGKIDGARWFDDPRRMLDEYKPDVVNVGSVFGHAGDFSAEALERGIHVVSDKPVAATWAQLARLRKALEGNQAKLLCEFNLRSSRAFRAARMAVRHGLIGEVVLASAQKSYRFNNRPAWFGRRETFTGLMLWVASHAIDFIPFCSGKTYSRVIATGGNLSQPDYPEMEDHVVAMFELNGGGSAMVRADYLRPTGATTHGDDRLRLAGTQGLIEIRNECCQLTNDQHPRDITKETCVDPVHQELLAAVRGERDEIYGTKQSLEMAEILLKSRDAQDRREWVKL